jgi:hypothetical protein
MSKIKGLTSYKDLRSIAEQLPEYDYPVVGLRVQKVLYRGEKIGKTIKHISNNWEDGNMLSSKIDGICAVSSALTSNEDYAGYSGNVVLVLGSDNADTGNDYHEIIMRDAVIIDVIYT